MTFPLVDWQMFTRSLKKGAITHYEYEAELASGEVVDFNPLHTIRVLDQDKFYVGHKRFAEYLRHTDDEALWSLHDEYFVAIVRMANRNRDENPIVRITVVRQMLDPQNLREPLQMQEVFRVVDIPDENHQ